MKFGPKSKSENKVFAKEGLRVDVQVQINTALLKLPKEIQHEVKSRLCKIYGSKRIFNEEFNPTLEQLALMGLALGVQWNIKPSNEPPDFFESRAEEKQRARDADAKALKSGKITREQLAEQNAFLKPEMCRTPIDFSKVKVPK